MKIKKFNENLDIEKDITGEMYNIMSSWLDLQDIPYTNDVEISEKSIEESSKQIFDMLVDKGIDFKQLKDAKKYNL